MENNTKSGGLSLSKEVRTAIPIFDILGKELPANMQTPEAKRAFGKIGYTALMAIFAIVLYKMLPKLIVMAEGLIYLGVCGFILALMIIFGPKIMKLLNQLSMVWYEKGSRAIQETYNIEWMRIGYQKVLAILDEIGDRITSVLAVALNMTEQAKKKKKEADENYADCEALTAQAKELERKQLLAEKDDPVTANKLGRKANEARVDATLKQKEYDFNMEMSRNYEQTANQLNKMLEILYNNESSAKISSKLLKSSIDMIDEKLKATAKIREATAGLADIFNIDNKYDFSIAMNAAEFQLNENIANIRRNLDYANEGNMNTIRGAKTQVELEAFLKSGAVENMQKLKIEDRVDASYEYTKEEKAKSSFNILDS